MKVKESVLFLLVALLLAAPAGAVIGSTDSRPASTLLLPYFEVNLDTNLGVTTLFSIGNASAAPALAQVTLWTNWSIPTLTFPVYLTGYDVETINVRSIFDGRLVQTGDAQNDPTDGISPVGPLSMDASFPGCLGVLPAAPLTAAARDRIRQAHTGQRVISEDDCLGADMGDNRARGYITIDVVNACSTVFPTQAGYFADGGVGIAGNVNQLWGDYFFIDPANNFAQGDNLVHIEANDDLKASQVPLVNPTDDLNTTVATVANATGYTFYGRYRATGDDNREPLATVWAARYLNGGSFSGGTQLIVWRDSTSSDTSAPGGGGWCGVGPSWAPLPEAEVIAFDLAEQAVELCGALAAPHCFELDSGRYQVGVGDLDPLFPFGWLHLNLNIGIDAPVGDTDFGTAGTLSQSHVSVSHSALGLFSVGIEALPLRTALQDDDMGIGPVP